MIYRYIAYITYAMAAAVALGVAIIIGGLL
jgi:hypothetical protein